MSGKCPYLSKKESKSEDQSSGKCPYQPETKTETSGKCPYQPETKTETSGKCPYQPESNTMDETSGKCPYQPESNTVDETSSKCPYINNKEKIAQSERTAIAAVKLGNIEESNRLMKEHFKLVYDSLADEQESTDNSQLLQDDNVRVIKILMSKLGYTEDQLLVIGNDVLKMQGTGNPHLHADIQPGHTVVDLGSGFGIDAFLAGHVVGNSGHVIGIDQSEKEVFAAVRRVAQRKITNVDFRIGDIEQALIADNSVDRVISNGGFCLVPNKRQAFKEIARILKPGGKFSISCTVRIVELVKQIKWPSCFHVFMDAKQVEDIVTSAGLSKPEIDDSNSSMTLWDKEEKKVGKGEKVGIHRNDETYDHLKGMDMDNMFARVTIYGYKPE